MGPAAGVRFERDDGLVRHALRLLEAGPLATAELAARVLGLRGDAPAAASAVFALLGADVRFHVSGAGVWALAEVRALDARRLREEEFVVVDVETTGGSPAHGHRVTEVAAVRVSGGVVRDSFSTLVNPGRRIPSMITALTGITQEMVADAPPFSRVAAELAAWVEGRVFVAHNAAFDWRFIRAEMERCTGTVPGGRTLCTVRVARKLLPHLPSRGLDTLAVYFGLEIESRHRALDDAVATAHLLLRLLDLLEDRGVADWTGLEQLLATRRPARTSRRRIALPRSMEQA